MTNPQLIALLGGTFITAACLWLMRKSDDDADAGILTTPLEEDLRLLRVCDRCRRVLSASRMVHQGQHLSICHDICPACAAAREAEVAALTDTKVRKLKLV